MANTTPARGRGPAPARVVLPAEIGADWRKLAAALDDVAPEELARLLGESYRRRPVETLAALGMLILRMQQDETAGPNAP